MREVANQMRTMFRLRLTRFAGIAGFDAIAYTYDGSEAQPSLRPG